MREAQIGVLGSMADLGLSNESQQLATELGQEIAKSGSMLLFGYEGDYNSFSEIAARAAESAGGKTVAFLWGDERSELNGLNSIRVVTGQMRPGGRELALVWSCDAVICIGGGSGTLMEIAMAYQKGIPTIVLEGTGGWSDKLSGEYLDERRRQIVIGVKTPQEAVTKALELTKIP